MAPRKCLLGCEGKLTLFSFPKEASTRQKWMELLFPGQKKKNSFVFVCQRHFTRDCFVNLGQYEAGLSGKLLLRDDALPTLPGGVEESEEKPITSQQILTSPQHGHMEIKTEPVSTQSCGTQFSPHLVSVGTKMLLCPSAKSVATQLAYGTLKPHVRSKGTQATLSYENVGTETTQLDTGLQFSSKPVRAFAPLQSVRPAKRAHLEFEEIKDEKEETIVPTYIDSITEPSESSGIESTTDTKYVVFESCLMDLFQTCPVCKRDCQVQPRRQGTYVAFTQLCLNCQYTRKWQSQPSRGNTPERNLQMSAAVDPSFRWTGYWSSCSVYKVTSLSCKRGLKQESSIAAGGDLRADSPGEGSVLDQWIRKLLAHNTEQDDHPDMSIQILLELVKTFTHRTYDL